MSRKGLGQREGAPRPSSSANRIRITWARARQGIREQGDLSGACDLSWLITSTRTDGALNHTPSALDPPPRAAQCGHVRKNPSRIDQRTRIQRLIQVRHPVEMRTHPLITNLTAACVQLWMTLQSCPMRTGDRHTSCESFLPRLVDMISPPCLLSAQIALVHRIRAICSSSCTRLHQREVMVSEGLLLQSMLLTPHDTR